MPNTKKYVSLDKLGLYNEKIKKYLADADTVALQSAKDYADGLAVNYDAAGSASSALTEAKTYTDTEVAKVSAAAATAQAAAEAAAAAASVADGKAVKALGDVDGLKTYVGTFTASEGVDTVVKYIDAKTKNIASDETVNAIADRVTAVEGDVATIKGDYLKAADKTELEGKITAVQNAVDGEKTRAEGIESGLRTDINTVMGDYLKSSDKTELQNNIDAVSGAVERLTNGVSAEEIDGVNDLIQYVKDHGTEVTGMQEDIADNAEAIAGVAGRMDTAEGKITTLEGAVDTKAEKSYVDEAIEALEGVDSGLDSRIQALEAKHGNGEGTVESLIEAAKQEAISDAASAADAKDEVVLAAAKKYAEDKDAEVAATVDALTEVVNTKAAQSEVDTISGKVATLETDMAQAKVDIDAVEVLAAANKTATEANAAAIALKAAQTDLDAVSGRVTAIETWHENFVEVSEQEINGLFTA